LAELPHVWNRSSTRYFHAAQRRLLSRSINLLRKCAATVWARWFTRHWREISVLGPWILPRGMSCLTFSTTVNWSRSCRGGTEIQVSS
jgi:hypothetical protein